MGQTSAPMLAKIALVHKSTSRTHVPHVPTPQRAPASKRFRAKALSCLPVRAAVRCQRALACKHKSIALESTKTRDRPSHCSHTQSTHILSFMTDALSELARERRECEAVTATTTPTDSTEAPPKKRKRPIYMFPEEPTSDEEIEYRDFVHGCRATAQKEVQDDLEAAFDIHAKTFEFYMENHSGMTAMETSRVILEIANHITAERLREMRRRVSCSVGASVSR